MMAQLFTYMTQAQLLWENTGIILGRDIERFSHIFPENLIEIFK